MTALQPFAFFFLDKKKAKNQGRKDYIPFLPCSYVQQLYYCGFNISSLLLDLESLFFTVAIFFFVPLRENFIHY